MEQTQLYKSIIFIIHRRTLCNIYILRKCTEICNYILKILNDVFKMQNFKSMLSKNSTIFDSVERESNLYPDPH